MFGIIGAMKEEVELLIDKMELQEKIKKGGKEFYKGRIKNMQLIVVESGVGKVNAAITTQMLIDYFQPKYIINTGIAGGLDKRLKKGDIVLSIDTVQYDVDTSLFGDPLGLIPGMETIEFPTSRTLLEILMREKEGLDGINIWKGRILSGDHFVCSQDEKRSIVNEFGGLCVEMEGAAVAHASYVNKVPCLIIRSISDNADGEQMENYEEFKMKAINNTTKLVLKLLTKSE